MFYLQHIASSFADYVPLMSEELNFISGQSDNMDRAQCLNLTIMDDTILENTEEFYAHLSYTPMEDRAVVFISPLNSNSTIYIQEDQSDSELYYYVPINPSQCNFAHYPM